MSVAVAVGRVVLAGVFVVAAWGKLSDGAGSRQAVRDFGAPARLAPAIAFAVPVAELTCAVLLLFGGSASRVGAAGAVVLLAVFVAAMALSLARGRRPDCHCFGRLSSEAVSARTLVRSAVLIGLAAFVLVGA